MSKVFKPIENKKNLSSIAIIICYIGNFPEWFPLWLRSCKYNDTIDFYLFTDQKLIGFPENVYVFQTSLEQLKERFSKILGFTCNLETPYKLCDYKVIYGEAFQEYIDKYDFWGHCDIDMVFGDLRKFITEDILTSFDRIFEVGHLSLFRNCKRINGMYREYGAMYPYDKVYKEKNCCAFDEHTGISRIFSSNHIATYNVVVCADIYPHYRAFYMMDEDTVEGKMSLVNYTHQIFTWESGKTFQIYIDKGQVHRKEVSYVHFMRKYPSNVVQCINKDKYCITYKKFIPLQNVDVDMEFILNNDYAVEGIRKKTEYTIGFIRNGWRALQKGEFLLRAKLRWHRVKRVNRKIISKI